MSFDSLPWIDPPAWWQDNDREWTIGGWTGRCSWPELLARAWDDAGEQVARDPAHQDRLRLIGRIAAARDEERVRFAIEILTGDRRE